MTRLRATILLASLCALAGCAGPRGYVVCNTATASWQWAAGGDSTVASNEAQVHVVPDRAHAHSAVVSSSQSARFGATTMTREYGSPTAQAAWSPEMATTERAESREMLVSSPRSSATPMAARTRVKAYAAYNIVEVHSGGTTAAGTAAHVGPARGGPVLRKTTDGWAVASGGTVIFTLRLENGSRLPLDDLVIEDPMDNRLTCAAEGVTCMTGQRIEAVAHGGTLQVSVLDTLLPGGCVELCVPAVTSAQ
jgi:hypothetical protein